MYDIIKKPVITEKAAVMNDKGVYIFQVDNSANKVEVKNAIKAMYGVEVESVRIVSVPSKTRLGKKGKSMVKRRSYKKAIISLKGKKTIDINVLSTDKGEKK